MNTYESTTASGRRMMSVRRGLVRAETTLPTFRGETATAAQAARLTQALGRWVPSNQPRHGAFGLRVAA